MNSGPNSTMASLYVGDLAPEVTEAMLFEKFSTVGPVLSIRVCRDLLTRRSLGYAYVNFQETSDAEKAIETMNFETLKDRPLRIMWSQRDPSLRKSGVGNIFIKNLDKSIDNNVMYDTFTTFGNILSCKVATDAHGFSKGYGFVHFSTEEAANNAIVKVNGMLLNGKKVFVSKFVPKSERQKTSEKGNQFRNVYVKHLTEDFDDQKLRQLFEPFGRIKSAKVMTDDNGKSKCFGFVSFEEPTAAENCVQQLNGKKEMSSGKMLYVARAQRKAERQEQLRRRFEELRQKRINRYKGINLYVKNLDESMDDKRLHQEFSAFGTITSAKVMCDQSTGRSRGFGFVCYTTPEEAQKAISEMNNRIIDKKPLYVALAQTREERKAFLASHFMQQTSAGNAIIRSQPLSTMPHPSQLAAHSQPHLIPTLNPAAAAMAYATNSGIAINAFSTHAVPSNGPHWGQDFRRNRRIKFY